MPTSVQGLSAALVPPPKYLSKIKHVHRTVAKMESLTNLPIIHWIAEGYSRISLPHLHGTMLCPTRAGFWICLSQDTGNHVYHRGTYEEGTLDIIRRLLRPGDNFVDVGASIGLMSLTASVSVGERGKVLAFEPTARRYLQLKLAIEANQITNIFPFQLGLGSSARETTIHHDRVSPSMVGKGSANHAEQVNVECLDTILEQQKISEIRMIKIDVEGFEFEVLEGAHKLLGSPNAPAICIEHGVYNDNQHCPLTRLLQLNERYNLYQLVRTKRDPSALRHIKSPNLARLRDNVFCLLPEHCSKLGIHE